MSYEMHGPCSASVYDSRPAAIDEDAPVAAYTLPPAEEPSSIQAKSVVAKPRKTPVVLELILARSNAASCSAA